MRALITSPPHLQLVQRLVQVWLEGEQPVAADGGVAGALRW
jgi:hypothetical protein